MRNMYMSLFAKSSVNSSKEFCHYVRFSETLQVINSSENTLGTRFKKVCNLNCLCFRDLPCLTFRIHRRLLKILISKHRHHKTCFVKHILQWITFNQQLFIASYFQCPEIIAQSKTDIVKSSWVCNIEKFIEGAEKCRQCVRSIRTCWR